MLLLGGARLKHVLRMVASWRPEEVVKHPTSRFEKRLHCGRGWCRYYLGVQAKLYRKFANQALEQLAHENNTSLDTVALIMSRGLTVTGPHYLNTREHGPTNCSHFTLSGCGRTAYFKPKPTFLS